MRNKKTTLTICLLTLLLGAVCLVLYKVCKTKSSETVLKKTDTLSPSPQICIKHSCYNIELALTPEEQTRGLMLRQDLAEDAGMLFVFGDESETSFWMKNTLIPLDIVWISSGKKIVYIKNNAQPCGDGYCPLIAPDAPAQYVLEVNAGQMQKIDAAVGDPVLININSNNLQ